MCSVTDSPAAFRRPPLRIIIATLTCASLLLTACGSTQDDSPTVPVENAVGFKVEPPRITLVDAGQGPQTELRYRDVNAGTQKVAVTIEDAFTPGVSTAADVKDTPGLKPADPSTFTATLIAHTQPAENSEMSSRSVFAELENPGLTGPNVKDDLKTARGFAVGWFGDDAGKISSVNFAAPTETSDETRALTEQFLTAMIGLPVIFPKEAVGPGGSWTVESRITGQTPLLQTMTYTLDKVDGNAVSLNVKVEQRPTLGSLDIQSEDGQAPQKLDVLNSTTVSEGQLTVDVTKPLPTAGSVALTTRIVYGTAESEHRVTQDTSTKVTFIAAS